MSEDELSLYSAYMSTLGNREDLFGDSEYVDKYITNPPADYDVPAEYLDDATFATLLSEAEKYIGYPYVWGGSNPSTSFDCSGFVSYVLTNSGLCNTGRLGAQGLYNICTPVSDPQPGDLVFFVGTYDTPRVSMWEFMWEIRSCCTAEIRSSTHPLHLPMAEPFLRLRKTPY
jgi:hypothetical protein